MPQAYPHLPPQPAICPPVHARAQALRLQALVTAIAGTPGPPSLFRDRAAERREAIDRAVAASRECGCNVCRAMIERAGHTVETEGHSP